MDFSDDIIRKFEIYKEFLKEWNKIINLTAIIDDTDIVLKHFLDSSLIALNLFENQNNIKTVLDMGTGAGFPGLVSAILYPDINFTLVDSVNKKIVFIEDVVEKLALKNVFPKHHHLDKKNSSGKKFDLVMSRAFMKPDKLVYFTKKYIKNNGVSVMLLTENQKEKYKNILEKFNPEISAYPFEGRNRYILKFKTKV